MNMSWPWTHDLFHGCSARYPLHHSDQLTIKVEGTSQNEEIVKWSKEALFSIALDDVVWNATVFIKEDLVYFASSVCMYQGG